VVINNIFQVSNHPKSILNQLKSADNLPFVNVLSSEMISKNMESCIYRDRFFSPDITKVAA